MALLFFAKDRSKENQRETNLNDSAWVKCAHAQCSTTDKHLIAPLTKALCPHWSPSGGNGASGRRTQQSD